MPQKKSLPVWVALMGSGLAGALVATQSRMNAGLSQSIGDGFVTAAVSFGSGLVILLLVLPMSRTARTGVRHLRNELRSRHLPVWALTGGFCGAFFVLGQGLVASVIGLAMFTVGIVAGQVFGGLVIDRVGLGPGGRVDPTLQRIFGAGLAILAVGLSVLVDLFSDTDSTQLWLMVVPLIAGMGVAWQSAMNGIVRAAAHSAITATLVNFVVGSAVLFVVAAISITLNGWPTAWPANPLLYAGGLMGVLFIGIAAMLVRTAGVLLLSMSNVAGQLIAAVAFEAGLPLANGATIGMFTGAAVALVAVVLAALPKRMRGVAAAS